MDSRGCKSLDEFSSEDDDVGEFDASDKTMRQEKEEEDSVIFEDDDSEVEGDLFL